MAEGFKLSGAETMEPGMWIDSQRVVNDKFLYHDGSVVWVFLENVCARSLPHPLFDHNVSTLLHELGRQYRYRFPDYSLLEYEITVEALHVSVLMVANLYKEV